MIILMTCCFVSTVAFSQEQGVINVTVSILPQKHSVEQIGGEHVSVTVMVPPGSDPHTYEPRPQQLVNLSKSSLYIAIGVPFENSWLEKFMAVNPNIIIVHSDHGIEKITMEGHDDGEGHDKDTHIADPHIWLSPSLAMIQARAIYNSLVGIDRVHAENYSKRYNAFIGEIDILNAELTELFSQKNTGNKFIVFHPSWGYFARAYNLEQVAIEIDGKEPKPQDLIRIISFAKEHNIHVIFAQPQFSVKSARTIADAIDGEVVMADPLAENWIENLRFLGQKLISYLR